MEDTDFWLFDELKTLNLLFVEDNLDVLPFAKEFFERFFKKVDIATNGKEALDLLKKNHYDILITDLVMPELDGFELIKIVKEKYPEIYIVVLSAFFDTDTLLQMIYLGVDGFLIKPINLDNFLKIMKKVLFHRRKYQNEIAILSQYKDIVDENLIVSKTDKNGIITYVNEAFEKISGFKKEELIGKPHNVVRHPDMKDEVFKDLWNTVLSKKAWRGVVKNRKKNGEAYYVDTVIKPVLDKEGNIKEFIALRKDITNFISAEKLINDKMKLLEEALLIIVKIDNFNDMKLIYDEDTLNKIKLRLLKRVKLLVKEMFNLSSKDIEEYLIAEDIFGFLIEKIDIKDIEEKLNLIVKEVINKPIIINGFEYYPFIRVSFSYGKEHLYQNAILGLEEIKESEIRVINANGLCMKKRNEVLKNMEILRIIEYALKNNKVISLFQPIIENSSKKFIKYESLVRIEDKDGNILTPYHFLDIAKKSGLYSHITIKVLENSFKAMKEKNIPVSINLSPSDILRDSVREKIYECLEKYRPKKGYITFEMLEDEIIKYPKTVHEFIDKVIELNADIAIDDFGEGYSNFTRVVKIKANLIKIDGSLIKDIDKDKVKQDVVEAIVNFAKKENKKTVAEFVENEAIFNKLVELGVDYSQGYYFSKPIRFEKI
jgi:PAS domain S-box-containing protein